MYSESESQLCPAFCDPMGYTVHGLLQARILEWVAFPFSRGSSQPRDRTQISCIAGGFFTSWAIREAPTVYIFYVKVRFPVTSTLYSHKYEIKIFKALKFFKFIISLGCAGSSLLHMAFSSYKEWGLLFSYVRGLLIVVASLVVEHRL